MKTRLLFTALLLFSSLISSGQWSYDSLEYARNWMGAATFGNKIYFAGGESNSGESSYVEIFDVATGTWDNPENLSVARSTLSAIACDSLVFFAGGVLANQQAVSTVDIWDTRSKEWTVQQLTIPRFAISAVCKDHKVLFAGGVLYNLTGYNRVDIYNTQTGQWSTSSLSLARGSMASAVVGDLAIFAGGIMPGAAVTDRVDIYNFATDTWSTASLSQARFQAEAVTIGNKVYIAGGMTGNFANRSDRVDIFDAETNSWSTASLSYARTSACAAALNGRAYFIGGGKFNNNAVLSDYSDVIDIYDPYSDTWTVDHLAEPVMTHSVACAGNQILVAGGKTVGNQRVKTVEIYTDHSLLHVPADYPTIQQAIDAATLGDTVLVAHGNYVENINFRGKKQLMVASNFLMDGDTSHIANTIIDGSQPANPDIGSVVTFESGEDTTSVLCGFSVTGGTGTIESSVNMRMGGGLHIKLSGGKFLNNHIHDNTVTFNGGILGGGMQLGGPVSEIPWIVLRGNRIFSNQAISTADYAAGGGFTSTYNLIMENNKVYDNLANGYLGGDGGGLECMGSFGLIELRMSNNLITNNGAKATLGSMDYAALGGGICIAFDCWGTLKNNLISNNSVEGPGNYRCWGAGVFVQDIYTDSFVFENNMVKDNLSFSQNSWGGGLSLLRTGGIYRNNVLLNNTATYGGGISILESREVDAEAKLMNNTITGNESGGLYISTSDAVVINSILYNNLPPGPAIHEETSDLEVVYSDVDYDEYVYPGEGNINEDPLFCDPLTCRTETWSPCVDAGTASYNIGGGTTLFAPAYDITGAPRPAGGGYDMGAYETAYSGVGISYPDDDKLFSVRPNPFTETVTFIYRPETPVRVNLRVFDSYGQLMAEPADAYLQPGEHTVDWNAAHLPAGIYYYRMQAGGQLTTGKIIKLR